MIELNKIYNDDCLKIIKLIDSNSIDLVVTDCPYKIIAGGVRIVYEKNECEGIFQRGVKIVSDGTTCSNKWLKNGETDIPSAVRNGKMFENNDIKFKDWLPEVYRVLKEGTHCYIMINGRNLKDLQTEAEIAGFKYQNLLVWEKCNYTPNKYYMQGAEFILMLSKRPARNINNMGGKNIFKISNTIGKKLHPTEKPVQLFQELILQSSKENDIVLDPFIGSGSTAMACINTNRNFIGIEIDEKYSSLAEKRILSLSQQNKLF